MNYEWISMVGLTTMFVGALVCVWDALIRDSTNRRGLFILFAGFTLGVGAMIAHLWETMPS